MRMEHIVYPYPHDGGDDAFVSRHYRQLPRLRNCGCYPYVAYDDDSFVIDTRGGGARRSIGWRLGQNSNMLDGLEKVRHLRFWIGTGREGDVIARFKALETLTFVVGGEFPLYDEQIGGVPDGKTTAKMLVRRLKRTADWKVPTVLFEDVMMYAAV